MNLTRFKLGHLGLAAAALFAASAASAAPITNWDYTVTSWFSNGADAPAANSSGGGVGFTAGDGVTKFVPSGTTAGAPANANSAWSISPLELTWGRSSGTIAAGTRSGLGITEANATAGTTSTSAGFTSGNVVTGGGFEAANAYTHYNRASIGANSWTLQSTVIDATLVLTADGGSPVIPFVANYQIRFVETPNTTAGCPTALTDAAVCSDIFVLDGLLGQSFNYGGYKYTFDFTATGNFGELLPAQCALAGVAAGCIGFSTPEGVNYTTDFQFRIKAEEIPEPGSIALLGAGLLGLAGIRRRQQKNKA
ncbi:THxN family PEP-CTERM protein [Pseudorhodoferax sp. LjRoot39]|uniref:THxN family PEP-CTERM protein n=1 Tax=Pseudorhodoferax sp. LjRoot39 TaxID=3342328 RepID=UPI003ECCE23A